MDVIPSVVSLTTYSGGVADFMATSLQTLIDSVAAGTLTVLPGSVLPIDEIVQAHRTMESNKAGGKIVVVTRRESAEPATGV